MSGSSGGNFGGGDSYSLDCDAVNFKTQLRSVPQDAIESLDKNMRLPVSDSEGTVSTHHPATGAFVGSITYSKNVELIRCMAEGFNYVATILAINDGLVTVQVTAA